MPMTPHNTENGTPVWPFWLAVGFVAAVWAITGLVLLPREDRGTIGDMFGAANALFSGLAFAGIIYTIWIQRTELQLQRKELALTRAELEGQKLQLQMQNDTLRRQNFENTFFQLLGLHSDILNAIDLQKDGRTTRGRDCFRAFSRRLHGELVDYRNRIPNWSEEERINAAYKKFFEEHQSEIGHYFRSLYNIVKFVKQSDVRDKRLYTNLIRAQLSSYELVMLFYNCISALGREKFKPLVEEFALLKTLPRQLLENPSAQVPLFRDSAYA
ncbi:MAG: putative phage abortive infection protein [Burkholderiaceae bacterium]|nr:putative phage abortive infection protein [Burkholderiaceae bacterium]